MFPQNHLRERRKRFKMENELMHFGVKGQKWGVRRYRNNNKKTITQRILERNIDADAKYKKDDIEKLNSYKDVKK